MQKKSELVWLIVAAIFLFFGGLQASESYLLSPPKISHEEQKDFLKWKQFYVENQSSFSFHSTHKKHYINELIMSSSPYLVQHATNPINWKPWGRELLTKAKRENKLIFLSIGYSTCHWCHVMNRESFTQLSIANELNNEYYSIKVDREELPHVDEYYTSALQQLKGEAGWPITAIINGDGLPIFVDSYMKTEKLLKLLQRVKHVWREQPGFLLRAAENIDLLIKKESLNHLSTSSEEFELSSINQKLVPLLDSENGGFLGDVKFPSEPMLLYVLDQLKRKHNKPLELLLKTQLDNMLLSGIFDHVGGGFHRYTTDKTWTVPHYEKMLYNQAQLIIVYAQAYEYFNDPKYLEIVAKTSETLLNDFYKEALGFVSAFDADFKGEEGGYYLWDDQELAKLDVAKDFYRTYEVPGETKKGIVFKWGDDQESFQTVDSVRKKVLKIRSDRGELYYDNKILTGWNAQAVKALIRSGKLLKREGYIHQAKKVLNYFWSERFDSSNGFLSRTGYDASNKKQSYLEDYAYLVDAYIELYDYDGDDIWLERAEIIQGYAISFFKDEDGGFFNVSDRSDHLSSKKSVDTELISPTAVIIGNQLKLDRMIGKKTRPNPYRLFEQFLFNRVSSQPLNHLYTSLILNNLRNGTTQNKRYFASANGIVDFVCIRSDLRGCYQLEININLKSGWHINSNKPLQDYLVPTSINLPQGISVEYPENKIVSLGFQPEALSVYEGGFTIRLTKQEQKSDRVYLSLPLQACNDRICMLPETMNFVM